MLKLSFVLIIEFIVIVTGRKIREASIFVPQNEVSQEYNNNASTFVPQNGVSQEYNNIASIFEPQNGVPQENNNSVPTAVHQDGVAQEHNSDEVNTVTHSSGEEESEEHSCEVSHSSEEEESEEHSSEEEFEECDKEERTLVTPLDRINFQSNCLIHNEEHKVYVTNRMTYSEAIMCCCFSTPRVIEKCIRKAIIGVLKDRHLNITNVWYPTLGSSVPGNNFTLVTFENAPFINERETDKNCIAINKRGKLEWTNCTVILSLVCF